jgi:hypothetical protein
VSKDGKLLHETTNIMLGHKDFVARTVGKLPEGARVVTFGKDARGTITVIDSMKIHGRQLSSPQWVKDVITSLFQ